MNQKAVFIAGLIGLVFGFLFAGTLGVDFFQEDTPVNHSGDLRDDLDKDEEAFRVAYNLESSIYLPIYGSDVYDKLENGDSFILYVGRETCPYCQQHVPNLQEAALNSDFDILYHVDSTDSSNQSFISNEGIQYTPITYFIKDGELADTMIGFKTTEEIETVINNVY